MNRFYIVHYIKDSLSVRPYISSDYPSLSYNFITLQTLWTIYLLSVSKYTWR